MKRDLKPFVVEVKRGTKRSSFLGAMDQSPTMSEAQRRAEAVLFTPAVEQVVPKVVRGDPSRRILQSLVEPPPVDGPMTDERDQEQDERRPRPVGRPRKIHPVPPVVPQNGAIAPIVPSELSPQRVAPIKSPALEVSIPVRPPIVQKTNASVTAVAAVTVPEERIRLRDRSSILARYVLGTEPAPGERWGRISRRSRSPAK